MYICTFVLVGMGFIKSRSLPLKRDRFLTRDNRGDVYLHKSGHIYILDGGRVSHLECLGCGYIKVSGRGCPKCGVR